MTKLRLILAILAGRAVRLQDQRGGLPFGGDDGVQNSMNIHSVSSKKNGREAPPVLTVIG